RIPVDDAVKPPQPRPGLTTYKLSSNENPYPPLPGVLEAATRAAEEMNRYPDMGSTAFYDPGDEVVYAWRSFEAYPIAVTAAGATSVRVPVRADGHHDLDAMAAAI